MQRLSSCGPHVTSICRSSALKRFIYSRAQCSLPPDFQYYHDYFSIPEQRILLAAALQKLDATESRQFRRRRRELQSKQNLLAADETLGDVQALFLPDEYYTFEEGHYDGVIKRFREMHVSSWPPDIEGLSSVIARLQQLLPSTDTQTHLLHLASDGEILPHIDNIGASGSWILGVSLGATRVLSLERTAGESEVFNIPLTPGSVYIQRDSVRYGYKHSILKNGFLDGVHYNGGQRLSIMVRDILPTTST